MGDAPVQQRRARPGPSLRGRRQQPATDTDTYQDSKCLSRLLLSSWAWHPFCPISRSNDVVPVEFGSENSTDSEAIEDYKRFFRPFIIEEALASVLKEAEDEIKEKQSMQIRFRGITDIGEGRADVSCVLVNNRKKNVGRKLKEGNLVFLLNVDPCSSKTGFKELCSRCSRQDSSKVAVFAGWIKFCGRVESDGLHIEVQHARSPGSTEYDETDNRNPHPGDTLSNMLMNALDGSEQQETRKWYLISCSSPVTSQREMASLEAMSRRDDVQILVRPSKSLKGQGGIAHRIWPEQLGFKPYIDYIKSCHDLTQLEAVEACAALCASPEQVQKFVAKAKPTDRPALLPIILIQGPPGTGKTHTVKEISRGEFFSCHMLGSAPGNATQCLRQLCGNFGQQPTERERERALLTKTAELTIVMCMQTVLNSWHLCQFQRFNDAQYQRLVALLQDRKAASSSTAKGASAAGGASTYVRPRNGALPPGVNSDSSSIRKEVSSAATSAAAAEELAQTVTSVAEKAALVPRPRILVCAPSNAATDELLKRVLEARFVDVHGRPYKPRVVRIGSETAAMSDSARKVWVDKIVANMLDNTTTDQANKKILGTESQQRSAMEQRTLAIQRLTFDSISPDDHKQTVSDYISAENTLAQLNNEHEMWTTVHAYLNQATSRWDAEEMLAASHMDSAEIVFTTLSSTGRRAFERGRKFDLVLIDEAAQASEAATLQPLTLGSGKVVLVGDPRQLPATILSKANQRLAFDRSLFQRLMEAGWPVSMLSVQYRMHPHIRRFPGKHFYGDELKDGHSVKARPMMQFYAHDLFKPYVVYDVSHGRDRTASAGSGSRWNLDEINMALALFQELRQYLVQLMQKSAKEGTARPQPCTVGIITPYREQCRRMRQAFEEVLGESVAKEVKIDTVDSFQGKQMDVIIMSCVRASAGDHSNSSNARALLGFVEDVRRMNVGITRARHALWLLGNAKTLSVNEHWRALFVDARTYIEGGCVIEDADAAQLFPDAKLWDPSKSKSKTAEKRGEDSGPAAPSSHTFPSGPATHIGGMHVPAETHAQLAADMHGVVEPSGNSRPPSMSQIPPQGPQGGAQQPHTTPLQQQGPHGAAQQQQQPQNVTHAKLEMKLPNLTEPRQGFGAGVFNNAAQRPPLAGGIFGAPAPNVFQSNSGNGSGSSASTQVTSGAPGGPGPSALRPPDVGAAEAAVRPGGVEPGFSGAASGGAAMAPGASVPKALMRDPRRKGGAEEPGAGAGGAKDPRSRFGRKQQAAQGSAGEAGGNIGAKSQTASPANKAATPSPGGLGEAGTGSGGGGAVAAFNVRPRPPDHPPPRASPPAQDPPWNTSLSRGAPNVTAGGTAGTSYPAPPDMVLQRHGSGQHSARAATPPAAIANSLGTNSKSGASFLPPDLLQPGNVQAQQGGGPPSMSAHAPPDLVMQRDWGNQASKKMLHSAGSGSQMHVPHAPARPPVPQAQTQNSVADDIVDLSDLKRPRNVLEGQGGRHPWQSGRMHAPYARNSGLTGYRDSQSSTPSREGSGSGGGGVGSSVAGPTGGRQYGGRSTHGMHAQHSLPPDVGRHGGRGGRSGGFGRGRGMDAKRVQHSQHDDEDIVARKMLKPHPPPGGTYRPVAPKHPPPGGGGGGGMPPPPDLLHLK